MLPEVMRPFAVVLGAAAAIIASQALITGSYTLVSEAILLDLLPHLEIRYPADTKGQLYIGKVNNLLWIGCSLVVLYFRSGARIESAYGLAITLTMLMTTLLLAVYLFKLRRKHILAVLVLVLFGAIESIFFISSLGKFMHGGYVTVFLTLILLAIMIILYRGTQLERQYCTRLKLREHIPSLVALHQDEEIPLLAHNLVYLEGETDGELMDRDILYSILDKDTKRAQAYWFVSVHTLNEPKTMNYELERYGTDCIFRIRINLGFKCAQRVNVYLRQIVQDMQERGELPVQDKKYSIYGKSTVGNFKFCVIHKTVTTKTELSDLDEFILNAKYSIRKLAGSKEKWYGLDTSTLIMENVPLITGGGSAEGRIHRA
jgi:KUP system potassium uptake protein